MEEVWLFRNSACRKYPEYFISKGCVEDLLKVRNYMNNNDNIYLNTYHKMDMKEWGQLITCFTATKYENGWFDINITNKEFHRKINGF